MVLAEEEYGVKDTDILHAIRVHTTGEADMGFLIKYSLWQIILSQTDVKRQGLKR